jgi:hypothetical protein
MSDQAMSVDREGIQAHSNRAVLGLCVYLVEYGGAEGVLRRWTVARLNHAISDHQPLGERQLTEQRRSETEAASPSWEAKSARHLVMSELEVFVS